MTGTWLAHNWGWVIFWVWVLGGFSWVADHYRHALATHHKRKVALAKARAKAASAPHPPVTASGVIKAPGPCVHRNVIPVIAAGEDEPVAWLCRSCRTQLPADWAVRQEDL